jgi:ABC-type uncharacterized transport system substrate-binding protein
MISYGASITDTYRRAADYVDKIIRGAHPANLPIQLPTKFEFVINLQTLHHALLGRTRHVGMAGNDVMTLAV